MCGKYLGKFVTMMPQSYLFTINVCNLPSELPLPFRRETEHYVKKSTRRIKELELTNYMVKHMVVKDYDSSELCQSMLWNPLPPTWVNDYDSSEFS